MILAGKLVCIDVLIIHGRVLSVITPSHIVYAWALSRSKITHGFQSAKSTVVFILGALTPDVPVYLFFIVEGLIKQRSQEIMWDQMYFESWWSILFTLSHSLIVWPLLFSIAWLARAPLIKWFALSGIIHICTDFLVHTHDAYKHFWPLSEWRFVSPLSYYDISSFGDIVGFLDSLCVIGLLLWLLTLTSHRYLRGLIVVLIILYSLLTVVGGVQVSKRF